tara:strand:+ start:9345 stop:10028 length:684 start_codon:yes stop_codon:yes gene_type:complete
MSALKEQLAILEESITRQCLEGGRKREEITLIAVSKTKPVYMIQEAYAAGQRHFGENKMQELQEKAESLDYDDLQWHMIGTLQTNKIKLIAAHVHWIHSVFKAKQLNEINKRAGQHNRVINVLIQVNISDEPQKGGCKACEIDELLIHARTLDHVHARGLMGMAKFTDDETYISNTFQLLQDLQQRHLDSHPNLTELSMGMSNDYALALNKGSTMLRIGSSIFGRRT